MMQTYLITYRKKNRNVEDLVEMPSLPKLLAWISKNASLCNAILIQVVEA